jgi:hypothetical protein
VSWRRRVRTRSSRCTVRLPEILEVAQSPKARRPVTRAHARCPHG